MPESGEISHLAELSEHLSRLCYSSKYSDVIFKINGETIHAHKAILTTRSKCFEAEFCKITTESDNKAEVVLENIQLEVFKTFLKYVYTGCISVKDWKTEALLQLLALSKKYQMASLKFHLLQNSKIPITVDNSAEILNFAHSHKMTDLVVRVENLLDSEANKILVHDSFLTLSEESLVGILQRDSFSASEVDIFKAVARWCKGEVNTAKKVMKYVRLSLLKPQDCVDIVRPTKLVECETLFDIIKDHYSGGLEKTKFRGLRVLDTNVATPAMGAKVLSGSNPQFLLDGDSKNYNGSTGYTHYTIQTPVVPNSTGILVELKQISFVNHMRMLLWDQDNRFYCYYIEVSTDKQTWTKIIDYSNIACRSWQELYFEKAAVKFINIVGTKATANSDLHLVSLEVFYKSSKIPKLLNSVIYPSYNVAIVNKGAVLIEGEGSAETANACLRGIHTGYDGSKGYSYHIINSGKFVIIELAQPYMLSSLKLLLWDLDAREYSFYIESSVDKVKWEMMVDRKNEKCKSWQNFEFSSRPVVFIKIVGTYNSLNTGFHVVYVESPTQAEIETNLKMETSDSGKIQKKDPEEDCPLDCEKNQPEPENPENY